MNATPHLAPSAVSVLGYLLSHSPVTISNATIGQHDRVGLGKTSVKVALRTLEDAGYVVVDRGRRDWHRGDATGRTLTITQDGRTAHLAALVASVGV
jgi:DNA-binding MarR family transcriptional regulator